MQSNFYLEKYGILQIGPGENNNLVRGYFLLHKGDLERISNWCPSLNRASTPWERRERLRETVDGVREAESDWESVTISESPGDRMRETIDGLREAASWGKRATKAESVVERERERAN